MLMCFYQSNLNLVTLPELVHVVTCNFVNIFAINKSCETQQLVQWKNHIFKYSFCIHFSQSHITNLFSRIYHMTWQVTVALEETHNTFSYSFTLFTTNLILQYPIGYYC